jgi:hypothetical protein
MSAFPRIRWFERREVWRLTWAGRALVLLVLFALLRLLAPAAYYWLSCGPEHLPPRASSVAVEGWLTDPQIERVAAWIRRAGAERVYCTGLPIEYGGRLAEFGSYAEITRLRLIALGVESSRVVSVTADPVPRERTYASALALKSRLDRLGEKAGTLWLVSEGPHARRSRMSFRAVLGPETGVEVVALTPLRFDASDWWKSSEGFKGVTYECVAVPYEWIRLYMGGRPPRSSADSRQ